MYNNSGYVLQQYGFLYIRCITLHYSRKGIYCSDTYTFPKERYAEYTLTKPNETNPYRCRTVYIGLRVITPEVRPCLWWYYRLLLYDACVHAPDIRNYDTTTSRSVTESRLVYVSCFFVCVYTRCVILLWKGVSLHVTMYTGLYNRKHYVIRGVYTPGHATTTCVMVPTHLVLCNAFTPPVETHGHRFNILYFCGYSQYSMYVYGKVYYDAAYTNKFT